MMFEFFRFELSMQRRQALYWIVASAMANGLDRLCCGCQ